MRRSKKRELFDMLETILRGPSGVGMEDSPEGRRYRIWINTWIVPKLAELHADRLEGVPLPSSSALYGDDVLHWLRHEKV